MTPSDKFFYIAILYRRTAPASLQRRIWDFPLAFPRFLCYKRYLTQAMNGKITMKRRQERSGHRLQARLWTPGLVRPGAAVETRPVRPPLSGPRVRAAGGVNPGGTAEGFAFRPRDGTRGVFCYHKDRRYEIEDRSFGIRQSRMIPIEPHSGRPSSYLRSPRS